MSPGRTLRVEADGGSRGNPGPAGYGAVVLQGSAVLAERAASIGRATNNVAEYRGLIAGLEAAAEIDPEATLDVRMDSKLVVEQMSGRWKVKHPDMRPLASQASDLVRRFPKVNFTWIPRAKNVMADRLANEAMDAAAAGRGWTPSTPQVPDPEPVEDSESGLEKGDAEFWVEPTPSAPVKAGERPPGWMAPSGSPTRTLLLRHGQTSHSVRRLFSGSSDPMLSPEGRDQARAAAKRLLEVQFDVVVSSPRRRAVTTAEQLGREVVVDDRFRETDFGDWEGRSFAEVRDQWPDEMDAWLADPTVAPPGGESFAETEQRVRAGLDDLRARYIGGTVVIVSHVTPIKTLVRLALEAPPSALYRLHLDLCSLSTVDWYADGPAVLRGFNAT
ncbi:MAG: ribonuclease / adenosylcobalamin/alpha-ribazole phosphatase [Frankiaceae bacterium]|nr:ribonuclease / adenosylcobalamin/alpha-ribazole phosphatase [Frankiaceae bacterium]